MVALVAFAITVPWLWLWPAWLNVLAEAYGSSGIGPQIAIPFAFRLAFAVILLALWRPWSRALPALLQFRRSIGRRSSCSSSQAPWFCGGYAIAETAHIRSTGLVPLGGRSYTRPLLGLANW